VVINCFNFLLSWKVFVSPSLMNDSFGEYINLGMNCFSFSVNYLTQTLLDFKFLLTNILLLWWVYHYLWFDISTLQFSIFFLVLCTNVLTITGHGDFLWIGVPSSIFGDFLLFVNWMFPMPLAYTSAPSYKGDTKFLHIPFVFLQSFLYAFICFFSITCFQVLKFCLPLVSVCQSGFQNVFIWLKDVFINRILI
jgi:hypothetical protein